MNVAPALGCQGVGKRYGSTWALRDCTLRIPAGSVTALVGPNGAGKTTLLQLAVGMNAQLDDNLGALQVKLDPEQRARLDEVSAIESGFPHAALRRLRFTR